MPRRCLALLFDESTGRNLDLVRALYDREKIDASPPHLLVVAPFQESTPAADLLEIAGLIVAVHQPFVLELGAAERFFDGEEQLLQFVATKGAEESQRLAEALYRDVFPHHRPKDPEGTPLQRSAVTVGRFRREDEAVTAAQQLGDTTYFCVITQVGMLESNEDGGWDLIRAVELGSMITST